MFDIPARKFFAILGPPALLIFLADLAYAYATQNPIFDLLVVGVISGLIASLALDAVRLIGVALGLFPTDMPTVFGVIITGLAPQQQRNMLATMVARMAPLPPQERLEMMRPRVQSMAKLTLERRKVVVTGMMTGLSLLTEDVRQGMLQTQMALLGELPSEGRRAIMATMDQVMMEQGQSGDGLHAVRTAYVQPRGMPKIPMATFRSLFDVALPVTIKEAGTSIGWVRLWGYLWHFINGIVLVVPYTLLFGAGSWSLAIGWGIFVWLMMMALMPPMMPMIRFPWWFVIWPFIAHIAFAIPYGYLALQLLSQEATAKSLLGALGLIG
ncbi:MAG: hypothetical protein HYY02_02645 [Chloroflexi bacterium]|nr:hypothetical protein [Chloroflexota bacterium]